MNWTTRLTRGMVIATGLCVAILLFVTFAPMLASRSVPIQQRLTNALVKSHIWLADGASIEPVTADSGAIGSDTYPIKSVNAAKYILGGTEVGKTTGGPNGSVLLSVHNISGSGISAGDFCVWDEGPALGVVGNACKKSSSLTITQDLTTETANGGVFTLLATISGTSGNYDTITVVGLDAASAAQTVDLSITGGAAGLAAATLVRTNTLNSSASQTLYWSKVTSVSASAAECPTSEYITITGYGFATIKASDGANTDFAGVAVETIADNDIGKICVYGPVNGTVDANSTTAGPGVLLELAANGDAVTDASATTGQNIGRCLEYSNLANYIIRVFVDSF